MACFPPQSIFPGPVCLQEVGHVHIALLERRLEDPCEEDAVYERA